MNLRGFKEFEKNCKFPHGKKITSIGYLQEVCRFIYEHPDLTKEDKLERILSIEKIIQAYLNGETSVQDRPPLGMKCKYTPIYSVQLKFEIKQERNGNKKKSSKRI